VTDYHERKAQNAEEKRAHGCRRRECGESPGNLHRPRRLTPPAAGEKRISKSKVGGVEGTIICKKTQPGRDGGPRKEQNVGLFTHKANLP